MAKTLVNIITEDNPIICNNWNCVFTVRSFLKKTINKDYRHKKLAVLGLFFIGMFCFCQSARAQSFQPCVVKEYNEELAKTPLSGVEVCVNDAGQRISDSRGRLTLRFLTKNVGDHVDGVEISKLGYEIFNSDAISQWNISGESRPFTIVMCKSERFKKIKDNYNKVSSESYAKQKRKEEIMLEKERQKGLLKEADYKRKLQELQDMFDKQSISVRPYIDHFARIDLSELSHQERDIIKLVKIGQIDSAIYLYKQMHLEDHFKDNRNSYMKLEEATKMLEEAKKISNEQRDTIFRQICRKNDVLMMQGGKENIELVEKSYKEIADYDTTYLYGLGAYSSFLSEHHRNRENLRYLHLIKKCGEREYHYYLSSMLNSIALAHFFLNENDSAKSYIAKSLEANERYCKNDSVQYLHVISSCYIVLAQIYNRESDLQNAEIASEKGLEYTQQLYKIDKRNNASALRMALTFAITFNQNKPSSVIEALEEQYRELLFSSDSSEEGDGVMDILFGTLGLVNQSMNQGKAKLAKRQLTNAIYRIQPLYDKDEQKYGNLLSLFSFFLGSLYYNEQDYSTAQTYLEKGQKLLRLDYKNNLDNQTLEPIFMGLMMLGDIKSNYGYREEADSLFKSAIDVCGLISQKEEPCKPDIMKVTILYSQYEHFMRYHEIDSAINALETIIKIDSIIQQSIPDSCSPPYEWVGRYELAKLYYQKERFVDAKNILIPCMIQYSDDVTPEQIHDAQFLFVELLVKAEKYEGAIQFIDDMDVQDEGERIKLLHYKAICQYSLGNNKKAKKIWNSIKEKLPEDLYNKSPLRQLFN